MFDFFANVFGYILNLLYNLVSNYGLAIILFTILIKLAMLPISIKQQKSLKKNAKIQQEMKIIQFKYKNDPEKMNQEVMRLYKDNNMTPFSGCLGSFLQLILLLSVFYMVSSPLKYMEKLPNDTIDAMNGQLSQSQQADKGLAYPEIGIIRNVDKLSISEEISDESIQKIQNLKTNMNFFGLDLSKIPQQNMNDYTVYIIPALYIITTFISMRLTVKMQENLNGLNENEKEIVIKMAEAEEKEDNNEPEEDPMMQTNRMMSWVMPILSVSIAFIAPLGLALYWLINNIAMILERVILDKLLKEEK